MFILKVKIISQKMQQRQIMWLLLLNWGCSKVKKVDLNNKVAAVKTETKTALQTMYDALNSGQQKKILKNEKVKTLFDRYNITY